MGGISLPYEGRHAPTMGAPEQHMSWLEFPRPMRAPAQQQADPFGTDAGGLSSARCSLCAQLIIAVGLVAVATLVRLALDPLMGARSAFMLQLLALFAVALLVRPWVYIAAALLALVGAKVLFIEPRSAVGGDAAAVVQLLIYALVAGLIPLIAWPARAHRLRAQREAERARRAEKRFTLALAHSQVTVYTTGLDHGCTWVCNPHPSMRLEDVMGRRADEILGEGGETFVALQERVLKTGELQRGEVTFIVGGERRVCDVAAEAERDSAGRIVGVAAACSDITARVRIEEELKAAQQRLALLWRQCTIACEASDIGDWSWDLGAGRIKWSSGMRHIMGAPPVGEDEELSPEEAEFHVHPEDRRRYRDSLLQLVEAGGQCRFQFRVPDPAAPGSARWVEIRAQVERDDDGRTASIIGIGLDISAHRASEEALSRRAAQLARSNDDLEDFAYIVSHDLKEPLRGISNYARFVMEDEGERLSGAGRDKVETIFRLTQRMYELLDALLEYSRVGRAELAMVDCDLREVAQGAVERLGPWLNERHATVEIDALLPRARCEGVRIGEVFTNLIANGVKYNDSSRKQIRIGARADGTIFVSDNGIGIHPRNLQKVFGMFKRLHGREEYGGGTGSGLAITRKIVERHGGRIWVESEPGCGSSFCFTLRRPESVGDALAGEACVSCAALGGEAAALAASGG
jgi:PAS domain S-box-containing protein